MVWSLRFRRRRRKVQDWSSQPAAVDPDAPVVEGGAVTPTIDAALGTAFLLALAAFLWWKTPLFSELRAWLHRRWLESKDLTAVDHADRLLEDARRIAGEELANRKAVAAFVRDCPPEQADVVLRTLDMVDDMRAALARKRALLDGDFTVLIPPPAEQVEAPVVRLASGARPSVVWRDGKPVPRG
jgi:hypothetical protein